MFQYRIIFSIIFFIVLTGCNRKEITSQTENKVLDYFTNSETGIQDGNVKIIPVQTDKGVFNVWTKRVGNNSDIKVLLLSGGPGLSHEYFECFENFFPQKGIEFIYYDQLGCGFSDNPNDTSVWDLSRYVEEVEVVRKALNLDNNNFFLLGHSWGGILAMQYTLKYQDNMKGLVISNMMASAPEYDKYAWEVLAGLMDPKVLSEIKVIEENKDFDNPRYMELLNPNFYEKHILRMPAKDWPEPVNRCFSALNKSLYVTMQGPSEFGISGKLEFWDVSKELNKIKIPTLVVGAKHDTMDPEYMNWMSTQIKNAEYLYCAEGSHMSLYDDQLAYFTGLTDFLIRNK